MSGRHLHHLLEIMWPRTLTRVALPSIKKGKVPGSPQAGIWMVFHSEALQKGSSLFDIWKKYPFNHSSTCAKEVGGVLRLFEEGAGLRVVKDERKLLMNSKGELVCLKLKRTEVI